MVVNGLKFTGCDREAVSPHSRYMFLLNDQQGLSQKRTFQVELQFGVRLIKQQKCESFSHHRIYLLLGSAVLTRLKGRSVSSPNPERVFNLKLITWFSILSILGEYNNSVLTSFCTVHNIVGFVAQYKVDTNMPPPSLPPLCETPLTFRLRLFITGRVTRLQACICVSRCQFTWMASTSWVSSWISFTRRWYFCCGVSFTPQPSPSLKSRVQRNSMNITEKQRQF